MAAFFTLGLQSQTTLETFFCIRRRVSPPPLFYSFDTPDTHPCLRSTLQLVHFKGVHLSQVHQLINTCTNRSLFGAAETAAPPDPGKSRVSPGNYIAKINGVHREVKCWHLLSTTHAGCNTRELIPLWHLLGRLPLASRLAVAHGEVHR